MTAHIHGPPTRGRVVAGAVLVQPHDLAVGGEDQLDLHEMVEGQSDAPREISDAPRVTRPSPASPTIPTGITRPLSASESRIEPTVAPPGSRRGFHTAERARGGGEVEEDGAVVDARGGSSTRGVGKEDAGQRVPVTGGVRTMDPVGGQRGLERSGDTVVKRCHRLSRLLEVVVGVDVEQVLTRQIGIDDEWSEVDLDSSLETTPGPRGRAGSSGGRVRRDPFDERLGGPPVLADAVYEISGVDDLVETVVLADEQRLVPEPFDAWVVGVVAAGGSGLQALPVDLQPALVSLRTVRTSSGGPCRSWSMDRGWF